MKDKLTIFVERLQKIGINIVLGGNIPWIYIDYINGKRIQPEDYYQGNHGFTVAWYGSKMSNESQITFTNIKKIFELIRKYR